MTLQHRGTGTLSNLKLRAKGLTCPPKEDCTTRRSTCTVFKGQRWKMGFVVCIASRVYHMIHPLPSDTVFFSICVFQMGGAHPNEDQAAGKGNDGCTKQGLTNSVPEWGAYVGNIAPWNRYPHGSATPCKRFFICSNGRLYNLKEHMRSIEGAKMENGVCSVHCITCMPHDPSSSF